MKKCILTLTTMSVLALSACAGSNNTAANELPSGGKSVDVTSDEGKESLKQCLNNTKEAYQSLGEGIGVSAKVEGGNLSVNASTTLGEAQVTLGVSATNVAATSNLKLAKSGEDGVAASFKNSITSGDLSLTGTLPGKEEGSTANVNQSLSFAGLGVDAYLSDSKLYADLTNTSTFVTNAETFVNGVLTDLKTSFIGDYISLLLPGLLPEELAGLFDPVTGQFTFAESYADQPKKITADSPTELKWSDLFSEESKLDIDVDKVAEYVTTATEKIPGFVFKTYDGGAFGFSINITKDSLKELLATSENTETDSSEKTIDDYFSKLNVSAAIYFNNQAVLEYAGLNVDLALALDDLSALGGYVSSLPVENLSLTASLSGNFEARFSYGNVQAELPTAEELATYEKIELPDLEGLSGLTGLGL